MTELTKTCSRMSPPEREEPLLFSSLAELKDYVSSLPADASYTLKVLRSKATRKTKRPAGYALRILDRGTPAG
jgi:hypothetical protein